VEPGKIGPTDATLGLLEEETLVPHFQKAGRMLRFTLVVVASLLMSGGAFAAPYDELTKDPLGVAAVKFLDTAFNQKQVDEAFADYVGPEYIQHNPTIADGIDAGKTAIKAIVAAAPASRKNFKRVIVQGDMVVVHSHVIPNPGDRGLDIVDIFRAENGKLVEHWDVIEPVPEKAMNGNTMF
jgi:predicted SnoaL-like aldol condensation-catalyzing enzyme